MRSFLFAAVSLLIVPASAMAQRAAPINELRVLPTRLVFEGRDHASALTLLNSGDKPATYRISIIEMEMKEDGQIVEVPSSPTSAASLIRFSPRQVTLAPGVAQTVRVQLRIPADLPTGEYRSHLVFRAIPDPNASVPQQDAGTPGLSVQLIPVFGVSIPLIVRHGDTTVQVSISDLQISRAGQGAPGLQFKLNRSGTRSAYGDLHVSWTDAEGNELAVATMNGVGIYVPNPVRVLRVPLPPHVDLRRGTLNVRFTDPNGGAALAAGSLPLR